MRFQDYPLSKIQVESSAGFSGGPSHSHIILVFLYSFTSRTCTRKTSGTAVTPLPSLTPTPWVQYWLLPTQLPLLEVGLGPSQCCLCWSRWTLCPWPLQPSLTWSLCTASSSSQCPSACTTMSTRSGYSRCRFAKWWVQWCTSTCTWPSYSTWSRWWSGGSSSFNGRTKWSFTGSCMPLQQALPCGSLSWSLWCQSCSLSMDARAHTMIQHALSSTKNYSRRAWKPWTTP